MPLAAVLTLLAALWTGVAAAQGQAEAARAYLAGLEPIPAELVSGRFEPAPDIVLETGSLAATGPRHGTVVFVPGYSAPLELYGRELRVLSEAGWDVEAIVMRGQGRSVRLTERYDLGHVEDYANLVDDLSAFVARQDGPVVVVGLSMGAHVALRMMAERRAPNVIAAATIVPLVRVAIPGAARAASRALARALTAAGGGERYLPGTVPWERREPFTELISRGQGTICTPDFERAHLRRALMEVDAELRVETPSAGWADATFRSTDHFDGIAGGHRPARPHGDRRARQGRRYEGRLRSLPRARRLPRASPRLRAALRRGGGPRAVLRRDDRDPALPCGCRLRRPERQPCRGSVAEIDTLDRRGRHPEPPPCVTSRSPPSAIPRRRAAPIKRSRRSRPGSG